MNRKSAQTLELPKILERLAGYAAFSASKDLARALEPTPYLDEARDRQQETTEARQLLDTHDHVSIGGARDVRADAAAAARGVLLEPTVLLDIKTTLRQATTLRRTIGRLGNQYPLLAAIAERLEECTALQGEIARVLDDTGEVLDSASPKLARLRKELRVAFDRLQSKLYNIIHNPNSQKYLQEVLVTQRHGRYVIPLKAEFKGRIQGIVHDQSASGATLFIEPLATVELNNAWREIQLEEQNEVRRILRELCDFVGHESTYIIRTVETLAQLDLIFAKAKYAAALDATQPELLPFRDAPHPNPGSTIDLKEARHPLLPPGEVVPIDVTMDEDVYALVITGPNTGGKTVALKTVGLLALMAQCGLHLPVAGESRLSVFKDVFADIGDEQSIEQSLSTFSSHMTNIITILEQADHQTLVILDELGAGTDPAEGSALARALLDDFLARGITTLVTTHHPELKIYGHEKPGVQNASVEFDLETLAPTYRVVIGLPGRSNALAIAEGLGLPQRIINDARALVGDADLEADDLLDEIHRKRDETRRAAAASMESFTAAEKLRAELRGRLENIEHERREVLAQAREEAEQEIEALRQELRRLRKRLQAAGQPLDIIKQVEQEAKMLDEDLIPVPPSATQPVDDEDEQPAYQLGDLVWVAPLNAEGQITELTEEDAEVAVGRLRMRASLEDLHPRSKSQSKRDAKEQRRAAGAAPRGAAQTRETVATRGAGPGLELDLRGETIEDAVPKVEDYLDAAYMSGMPFVRIIHGKGTGALRAAIRDRLHGHPLVKQYKRGDPKEGGDGVTIVNLVENA